MEHTFQEKPIKMSPNNHSSQPVYHSAIYTKKSPQLFTTITLQRMQNSSYYIHHIMVLLDEWGTSYLFFSFIELHTYIEIL